MITNHLRRMLAAQALEMLAAGFASNTRLVLNIGFLMVRLQCRASVAISDPNKKCLSLSEALLPDRSR